MSTRPFHPGLLFVLALMLFGSACAAEPEAPGSSARSIPPSGDTDQAPVHRASLATPADSVKHSLEVRLRQEALADQAGSEAVRQGLERFYEKRRFEPAWLDGRALGPHAEALIADLCRAEEEALRRLQK